MTYSSGTLNSDELSLKPLQEPSQQNNELPMLQHHNYKRNGTSKLTEILSSRLSFNAKRTELSSRIADLQQQLEYLDVNTPGHKAKRSFT